MGANLFVRERVRLGQRLGERHRPEFAVRGCVHFDR
jgi:hypothetical protein